MPQTDQEKFYDDKNQDGVADGFAFLSEDKDKDGRPDFAQDYLKGLELKFFLSWLATAIGVLIITLLADAIGHALGLH